MNPGLLQRLRWQTLGYRSHPPLINVYFPFSCTPPSIPLLSFSTSPSFLVLSFFLSFLLLLLSSTPSTYSCLIPFFMLTFLPFPHYYSFSRSLCSVSIRTSKILSLSCLSSLFYSSSNWVRAARTYKPRYNYCIMYMSFR